MAEPGTPGATVFTLGSASPRRAALLDQLSYQRGPLVYTVETVDIDEAALLDPVERGLDAQVSRIAHAKFAAFGSGEPSLLLTADTLVGCDGQVMGKPSSDAGLADSLLFMSGRALTISTALCVGERTSTPELRIVSTVVQLRELAAAEIERYVDSGAGRDKAGGLALQSEAGAFIESVHGCWSNVLGLPLCQAAQLLAARVPGLEPHLCSVDFCGSARG